MQCMATAQPTEVRRSLWESLSITDELHARPKNSPQTLKIATRGPIHVPYQGPLNGSTQKMIRGIRHGNDGDQTILIVFVGEIL